MPALLVKEIIFSPLYILASFVKHKVSIGAWIYLLAFYSVPVIYISVFEKYGMLHEFSCHPCTGAMLIFSVSFQF